MSDYTLTGEQADALLAKLSSDDAYRELFLRDITAAFAQLPGQPAPPQDLTEGCCLQPRDLASKQQISDARDALRSTLTSKVEYIPHLLER